VKFNNLVFENRPVYAIMWKHGRAEQPTGDNMSHAQCMLDNYGYRHIFRICKTHWFSTATVVTL